MNAMMRAALCAGIFIMAVQSIEWFSPGLLGKGLPSQSAPAQPVAEPEEREGKLENERLAVLARVTKRRLIIDQLINRRLMLREAAARFSELETGLSPALQLQCRLAFPARSDGEHFCMEVVAHAAMELREQPVRARQLVAYLRS